MKPGASNDLERAVGCLFILPASGENEKAGRMGGLTFPSGQDRQADLKRAINSARAGSVSVTAAPNSRGVSEASSG